MAERVQATAEHRAAVHAGEDVDLDLLVRDVLLAQQDTDAARHDREGMPVQADHRSRIGKRPG
jgi:hypothetical protein